MIDIHSVVWDLLASGHTEEEIYYALSTISEEDIEEVRKDFDEMED